MIQPFGNGGKKSMLFGEREDEFSVEEFLGEKHIS